MSSALPLLLGYAQTDLDRHSERREDQAFLDAQRRDGRARAVVIAGDIPVLKRFPDGRSAGFLPLKEAEELGEASEAAFLGTDAEGPLFGLALAGEHVERLKERGYGLADMRTVAMRGFVTPQETSALGMAKALFGWHATHRFCAKCGKPSRLASAGWRRDCPSCGGQHFPRTDPVVIMLAHHGDKCLLGRSGRFASTMYSCLAGFLEPGETVEQAVRRETMEEAGVACGRVDYLFSQPWPFPMSLMIGCLAEAESEALTVDRNELEDARWFTRSEARAILAGTHEGGVTCPPAMAIAHHILRAWAERQS